MNNLILNSKMVSKWFADNGDYTHNINYDLKEDSSIMDFGGYTGVWAEQMINKYNPNVYILEPIRQYFDTMVNKFSSNSKVSLLNVGVSNEDKIGKIYLKGDATSTCFENGDSVEIQFHKVETILKMWNLDYVDLLQINIEGDEYPLLENMIETGTINKFKNVQIQFHLGIKNDVERRDNIRNGLISNGYRNKFNYPFVWESWTKQF
jgi:FkbM family methyltransferase